MPNVIFIFAIAIILGLAYRGYRCRLRKGLYKEYIENSHTVIQTNFGKITFNLSDKYLLISSKEKGDSKISFDGILKLNTDYSVREARLSEFLFEDFDIFDFFGRYRDLIHIHTINICLKQGGVAVPIFTVSQYEVRDFLDFITPVQLFILSKLGFYKKADEYCELIFEKLSSVFENAGISTRSSKY